MRWSDLDPKKFWDWDLLVPHPTVSAGPYRFVRYVPETMMEFEANPNYLPRQAQNRTRGTEICR